MVIGTGFAGAVTACRLAQAGQRICILERGRRYEAGDLPVYPTGLTARQGEEDAAPPVQPDLSRALWAGSQGLWDLRDLGDVVAVQAAGYGGGSLVYANVHLRAPAEVFAEWPAPYRDRKLEPYYDLAAFMLGARPMPPHLMPPKRRALARAAEALAKEGDEPRLLHFDPPLAVNFPDGPPGGARDDGNAAPRRNRWGREQGTCDLRGDCCFGCPVQAKNTLDRNYLALAEDADPPPDVRTLAEAVSIEREADDGGPVHRVVYRDHLFGGREVGVRGRAVFLCAGAVNTTELLMRCRRAGRLACPEASLGTRYHPNADTLAAVFDCDGVQEVDRGPTITGSLLYTRESDDPARRDRGGPRGRDWLLIQDGGLPTALEPLLGVFRSPLWARRNRYRERPEAGTGRPGRGPWARLPFQTLMDALADTPRRGTRPGLSTLASLGHALRRDAAERGVRPGSLDEVWEINRRDLLEGFVTAAEPVVDRLLGDVGAELESRFQGLDAWIRREIPIPGLEVADVARFHLARRVLRLAVQLVWRSQGGMVQDLVDRLHEIAVPPGTRAIDRATDLLRYLLDYRVGDGHTALLLSMGRDAHPGTLRLCAEEASTRFATQDPGLAAPLRAALPRPPEASERGVQERILRDLAADAWNGELRTNPASGLLGRHVTVHSQGGCPMGEVTDADGTVAGCPGLYVMDAAAFPTAVGVNPSATIAAVAEYKIQRYIREGLGLDGWEAPELEDARADADRRVATGPDGGPRTWRDQLDPLRRLEGGDDGAPRRRTAAPRRRPVGIRFAETMEGFHAPSDAAPGPDVEACRRAERRGVEAGTTLRTRLEHVEIRDLAGFLERHERARRDGPDRGAFPRMRVVEGTIELDTGAGTRAYALEEESTIALRDPGPGRGPEERHLGYELRFRLDGRPHVLRGTKILRDDPGLDLWQDTSTLYFDLVREEDGREVPFRRGAVRVPAGAFLETQLPSFVVTHTEDPARRAWALAAFGRWFLDNLTQVYVPEVDRLIEGVKSLARRTHV